MGAYLSEPVVEKVSHDETHDHLEFGISGMQGWRTSMEDAHCAIADVDGKKNALFGVFDGHGGEEVAKYCADNFHKFLLDCDHFMEGNVKSALKDSFMNIDQALTTDEVIEELKTIAGVNDNPEAEADEVAMLLEETDMPMDQLLERFKENVKERLRESGMLEEESEEEEEEEKENEKSEEKKSPDMNGDVNGHDDKLCNGKSKKSRKQKQPTKRTEGANEEAITNSSTTEVKKLESGGSGSAGGSSSSGGSTSAGGSSGSSSAEAGGSSGSSSAEAGGSSGCSSAEAGGSSSGGSSSKQILAAEEDEDDDPDYEAKPGDAKDIDDEEEEEEEDSEEESDEDDEEESGDDEEEFEDSEGVEFQQGLGQEVGKDSGTTAIVALIYNNKLYVANVGDSRCVLCRNGKAVEMSVDHKPEDESEKSRIEGAGAKIVEGRVNGGLNLTRAIGDHAYKQNKDLSPEEQAITALPDIEELELTKEDEFMVLACDGIWNVMTSEEVIDFVKERLQTNKTSDEKTKLSQICEELFDRCIAPDTNNDGTGCDNMTCQIVRFKNGLQENGQNKREHVDDESDSKQKSKKAKLS